MYGGDISRKRKLWKSKKTARAASKRVGQGGDPQEAFLQACQGRAVSKDD